jgi:hypothetical protein
MTQEWTTKLPRTGAYGIDEAHGVFFEHRTDRGGLARAVVVQIPEATAGLAEAMAQARRFKARVAFICDTREQADDVARQAAPLLPRHRRVALERAADGGWGLDA